MLKSQKLIVVYMTDAKMVRHFLLIKYREKPTELCKGSAMIGIAHVAEKIWQNSTTVGLLLARGTSLRQCRYTSLPLHVAGGK